MIQENYDDLLKEWIRLKRENARLVDENERLRQRVGAPTGFERRIEQAYRDADILIGLHLAGIYPSRRAVRDIMGPRRHANALALLRLGRVYNRQSFTTADPDRLSQALERACQTALRSPESWEARQPRYNQKWRRHIENHGGIKRE